MGFNSLNCSFFFFIILKNYSKENNNVTISDRQIIQKNSNRININWMSQPPIISQSECIQLEHNS